MSLTDDLRNFVSFSGAVPYSGINGPLTFNVTSQLVPLVDNPSCNLNTDLLECVRADAANDQFVQCQSPTQLEYGVSCEGKLHSSFSL